MNQILNTIILAASVQARSRFDRRPNISSCSDFDGGIDFNTLLLDKRVDAIPRPCPPTPDPCNVTPCTVNFCDIPFNCFINTCAYKFTESVYLALRNLLLPNINISRLSPCCNVNFYERPCNNNDNIETEVSKLLGSIVSTVPPEIFPRYYDAYRSGNYYDCYSLLQRYFNSESSLERSILDIVLVRNKPNRRKQINAICFIDPCTRECSIIDLPECVCDNRVCLYLPSQVLRFEEFICLPFSVDEAIICEIEHFVPAGLKRLYKDALIKFYKNFKLLTIEQKIVWWIRIKFLAFNSIGYAISYLSTGAKAPVVELLLRIATSENDAFYLSYARSLGLVSSK